jgi:PAS domain S-box-containing protein
MGGLRPITYLRGRSHLQFCATGRGKFSAVAGARRRIASGRHGGSKRGGTGMIDRTASRGNDAREGAAVPVLSSSGDRRLDELYSKSLRLLCVVGFDGFVKQTNPAWDALLGYTGEELMALPVRELIHPDDAARMAEVQRQLLNHQCVLGTEVRVRLKDGTYKSIIWNAVPCVDEDIFFVTAHDITQRKVAEDRLRESQERFQLVANATREAIWDWDARTGRVWRNEEFINSFGGSETVEGNPLDWWCERVHPDDQERVMAYRPTIASDGRQQWALEYRLRRRDGSYAHVYDRGFVIINPSGKPVRMVGSVLDVSAMKDAEQKLSESEDRFRLATRAMHDAVWDWDIREGKVWRSEGFREVFGYDARSLGNDVEWWSSRIHPADRERVVAAFALEGDADSKQRSCEYRFRRADGTYAAVFSRGFIICDGEGKPVRMVGSLMDVSARRRAEEVAHMQRAELAHFARLRTMGEIATGVAHDLNQPLTAISNYAEICAHAISTASEPDPKKLLEWLGQIVDSTQRAAEMIRRLRRFARKSEPLRAPVEVNELVEEAIGLLETEAQLHNIRVHWQPIPTTHATLDRVQIQQVLTNLLLNAFEAMADATIDPRQVSITATANAERVEIAVEDQGNGVAAEDMDSVFEAFFTTKAAGLGIGLAISRSIVEDHGGRLSVDRGRSRGAVFRMSLPLQGAFHDSSHRGGRR